MKQPTQNLIVDIAAFVAFVFLAATGVVMVYVLPPGSGHSTLLAGMDRHEWGDIHFWVAVLFVGLLAVHLVLHWKWIVAMIKGKSKVQAHIRSRIALGIVGLMVLLALAVAPLFIPTEQVERPRLRRGASVQHGEAPAQQGTITLGQVAYITEIPVEHLIRALSLPEHASPEESLQQIEQRYGVDMEDVRRIVHAYEGPGADTLEP